MKKGPANDDTSLHVIYIGNTIDERQHIIFKYIIQIAVDQGYSRPRCCSVVQRIKHRNCYEP